MNQFNMNNKNKTLHTVRSMSTGAHQTPGGGLNKGLVAGALAAVAGIAYVTQSKKDTPLPTKIKEGIKETANKTTSSEHNPMVHEKVSAGRTKSDEELALEHHAKNNVGDTSGLVEKDTNKVKDVWSDNGDKKSSVVASSPSESSGGFWSNVLGKDVPKTPVEQSSKSTFDKASTANGNPMVYEKRSADPTKPGWEKRLEHYAEHVVRDTSTLVGKDTEKVRGIWEDKAIRDNGGIPKQEENTKTSFWSTFFGQANDKLKQAEHTIESEYERESQKASNLWQDVKSKVSSSVEPRRKSIYDQASDVGETIKEDARQVGSELNKAQRTASQKASEIKRDVTNELKDTKDYAAGSIKDLHNEVSNNAEKWKSQTEKNTKSWFQKSTEQVKDNLGAFKSQADKEINQVGQKLQSGINGSKEEADRYLSNKNNSYTSDFAGYVTRGERFAEEELGQLRPTRLNTSLTPAELIVSNANADDM